MKITIKDVLESLSGFADDDVLMATGYGVEHQITFHQNGNTTQAVMQLEVDGKSVWVNKNQLLHMVACIDRLEAILKQR